VGEWKLYLRAAGFPAWQQSAKDWTQTDEHPVVWVSWHQAVNFCEWFSKVTGKEWRLPTNAEWEAAVGTSTYPWGDYFPPHSDDGNYAILADGKDDPKKVGVDGIRGTAPVGSFKPNALGFFDLGGNVAEWMQDGSETRGQVADRVLRGGNHHGNPAEAVTAIRLYYAPTTAFNSIGFRLARGHRQSDEGNSR
jgi:formylglycine-generating enzyme required for sulfatase activity